MTHGYLLCRTKVLSIDSSVFFNTTTNKYRSRVRNKVLEKIVEYVSEYGVEYIWKDKRCKGTCGKVNLSWGSCSWIECRSRVWHSSACGIFWAPAYCKSMEAEALDERKTFPANSSRKLPVAYLWIQLHPYPRQLYWLGLFFRTWIDFRFEIQTLQQFTATKLELLAILWLRES